MPLTSQRAGSAPRAALRRSASLAVSVARERAVAIGPLMTDGPATDATAVPLPDLQRAASAAVIDCTAEVRTVRPCARSVIAAGGRVTSQRSALRRKLRNNRLETAAAAPGGAAMVR